MYRSGAFLFTFVLAGAALPFAAHAGFPLLDPNWSIVPDAASFPGCSAGDPLAFGAVLQLIQNLMNAAIAFTVVFSVLVFVYAGILLMTSVGNSENISKAKGVIWNGMIGLLIVLSAWLVVDFVMKVLYVGEDGERGEFLPWNEVLTDGDACIKAKPATSLFDNLSGLPPQVTGGTVGGTGSGAGSQTGTGGVPTPSTRGICTPQGLKQAGWPSSLSTKMSCVTKYENASCNPSAPSGTDIGADGKSVSIGLFQVNISAHDMNYPQCKALNGGQPLNCTQAFSGGAYTASNHDTRVKDARLYQICRAAASNPSCNTAAAIEIYNKQGIRAWGTRAQNACSGL